MAYQRRIIDDLLDEVFPDLAAIALEGAKGVGKTATAMQRARTTLSLSDEFERSLLAADAARAINMPTPVLIDEWQLVPEVWDTVRRAVDDDPTGGRFLLAGSAGVAAGARIHSGAGRIVSLPMRPLSVAERALDQTTVSIADLLGPDQVPITGQTDVALADYVDEILRSGFPGIRNLGERARDLQLDSYISRIVTHELIENGVTVRQPQALLAWLRAYGAATATDASYSTILDAATGGLDEKPARSTVDGYRDQLQRLFVLDPLPAWSPAFNPLKRLTRSPKHHLVDPALAARLVGIGKRGLLQGQTSSVVPDTAAWLGALFESLVVQSVRVYSDGPGVQVGHLRTRDTAREIDIVVEGHDRRVVAIEVKLAATVVDRDVRHLNWLHQQIGDRIADRVIVTTGKYAYRRQDGVAVVPLALLGP